MIETSRPKPPIRRLSGCLLTPCANGGLLQTAAKRQFLNRNTASIGPSMSLILNGRKCPNRGKIQSHTFGISRDPLHVNRNQRKRRAQ
jgi:hypothetical protein